SPSLVDRGDVAGAQPAAGGQRRRRGLLVAEIAEHDLWPTDPELAGPAGGGLLARLRVDETRLRARQQGADRAVHVLVVLMDVVRDRTRLGQAIALLDATPHAALGLGLELGAERRRTARDEAQAREVVLFDERVPGERQHD